MERKIIPFPTPAADPAFERALFLLDNDLKEVTMTIAQAAVEPPKSVY